MIMFNDKAFNHARGLVIEGQVDRQSEWSFSPADGNKILGDPPDWEKFSLWHLGTQPGVDQQNKGFYKFPVGKDGKVYRSALVAIIEQTGQMGNGGIMEQADKLLQMVDGAGNTESVQMSMRVQGGTEPPEWIHLLPFGIHETVKGRFEMDQESAERVVLHFNSYFKNVDMVVDFEHQSREEGEAPASGWISEVEIRANGLWGHVQWTLRATELLAGREYRYLSPVVYVSKKDRKAAFLESAALTNNPAFRELEPVIANTNRPSQGPTTQEDNMFKKVLVALGLDEGAGEAAAVDAVTALALRAELSEKKLVTHVPIVASMGDIRGALGVDEKLSPSHVTALVLAAKSGNDNFKKLELEVIELKGKLQISAEADVEALVATAIKDGKVLPASETWAKEYAKKDPEGFEVFLASAPVIVPPGEMDDAAAKEAAAKKTGGGKENTETLAVMTMCGVSQEDMDKYANKDMIVTG